MKYLLMALGLFSAAFIGGCSSGDVTLWEISGVQLVGEDLCEFHDESDPISGIFEIAIDGSTVSFTYNDSEPPLEASTDDFSEQDNVVNLLGSFETSVEDTDCTVGITDEFTLTVTDEDLRLENNDVLTVEWTHSEDKVSAAGSCEGDWFALPCTVQLTFTLTKTE